MIGLELIELRALPAYFSHCAISKAFIMISVSLRKQGMCHVIPQTAANLSRLPAKLPFQTLFARVTTEKRRVSEREEREMNQSRREAWIWDVKAEHGSWSPSSLDTV